MLLFHVNWGLQFEWKYQDSYLSKSVEFWVQLVEIQKRLFKVIEFGVHFDRNTSKSFKFYQF